MNDDADACTHASRRGAHTFQHTHTHTHNVAPRQNLKRRAAVALLCALAGQPEEGPEKCCVCLQLTGSFAKPGADACTRACVAAGGRTKKARRARAMMMISLLCAPRGTHTHQMWNRCPRSRYPYTHHYTHAGPLTPHHTNAH